MLALALMNRKGDGLLLARVPDDVSASFGYFLDFGVGEVELSHEDFRILLVGAEGQGNDAPKGWTGTC